MRFSHPYVLWGLLLIPVLYWQLRVSEGYLEKVRKAFSCRDREASRWRRRSRILLPLLASGSLVIAMAGPQATIWRPESPGHRIRLVIGIDVSKSMLAEDVLLSPGAENQFGLSNRLNLARQFISVFLREIQNEKGGLFFFARTGVEVVPLTRDRGYLRFVLHHVDASALTESGSRLEAALQTGRGMLEDGDPGGIRVMLLLTDGEDTEADPEGLQKAVSDLSRAGIKVFSLAVGKERDVLIPIRRTGLQGINGFYRDPQGGLLQTRMEPRLLKEIARETGGDFFYLRENDLDRLSSRMRGILLGLEALSTPSSVVQKSWLDLSPAFLLLALLCYGGFFLL